MIWTVDAQDQKSNTIQVIKLKSSPIWCSIQRNISQNLPDEEYHEPACEACLQPDISFRQMFQCFFFLYYRNKKYYGESKEEISYKYNAKLYRLEKYSKLDRLLILFLMPIT